jgi:putative membrane protein
VYKEDGLEQDQLVISRFLITHCVADASIIGFLSELPEAPALQEDSWIEVNGILDISTYNGIELPVIKISNWKIISEPKEPYLYPITVRLL